MSKFSAASFEPYDGKKLTRWLTDTYRPTLAPESDHIWSCYEVPGGRRVVVPGPSAAQRQVAKGTARKIAEALGLTYEELREAIGHPIVRHSKPSRRPVKSRSEGRSKADVLAAAKALHRSIAEVEQAVKPGVRDSAFYARVHVPLVEAARSVDRALSEAATNPSRRTA